MSGMRRKRTLAQHGKKGRPSRSGPAEGVNLTLAARNAVTAMIDHLGHEYGYTRQQAYAVCSVAVDLKISQVVDLPNVIVSAFLPLDIFV